jgi:hypothetical protein
MTELSLNQSARRAAWSRAADELRAEATRSLLLQAFRRRELSDAEFAREIDRLKSAREMVEG